MPLPEAQDHLPSLCRIKASTVHPGVPSPTPRMNGRQHPERLAPSSGSAVLAICAMGAPPHSRASGPLRPGSFCTWASLGPCCEHLPLALHAHPVPLPPASVLLLSLGDTEWDTPLLRREEGCCGLHPVP
ncbi:hypothetical protein MC885_015882, partial [Smutsia gigantea]